MRIQENEDDEEGGKVFVSFSAQSEEGYLICGRLNQRRIRENRERKRYFRTTLSFIVYVVWYTYDILLTSCDSQLILFLGSVVNYPSSHPPNSSNFSQNWSSRTGHVSRKQSFSSSSWNSRMIFCAKSLARPVFPLLSENKF